MCPELAPVSTPNMIPPLYGTGAPFRSALSLLPQSSPHQLVDAYHFISRSHIPWRHKYGTCGIVSSTAASSDSTIKLVYKIKEFIINENYTTFDSSRAYPIETRAFCLLQRNK